MKDYRLNKNQLEHLKEECLFSQGPIEFKNIYLWVIYKWIYHSSTIS